MNFESFRVRVARVFLLGVFLLRVFAWAFLRISAYFCVSLRAAFLTGLHFEIYYNCASPTHRYQGCRFKCAHVVVNFRFGETASPSIINVSTHALPMLTSSVTNPARTKAMVSM